MDRLAEQLHHAGVSSAHVTRYLQQVRTFRAQLQTAFAPADAARILAALELMVELHLEQAPRPDGTLLEQRGTKRTAGAGQAAFLAARHALYAEHVREAIRDPDVALIKLFDVAANALTLDAIPDAPARTRLLNKYTLVMGIMLDRLRETATPLNITPQKREELLARFVDALQT
jgi:hypothetical protein